MDEQSRFEQVVAEVQKVVAAADQVIATADGDERTLRSLARQPHRIDHAQLGRIHRHYGVMLDAMTTFELLLQRGREQYPGAGSVDRLVDKAQQARERLTKLCALVAEIRSPPTAATVPGLLPS